MQFVCVIASHLSSRERAEFLYQCLLSTLYGLKADKIIVSYSSDSITPIIPDDKRIKLIEHDHKMFQFEHIESTLHLINDTDLVIFMDDDDLFLSESRNIIESILKLGYTCAEGRAYSTSYKSIGQADKFTGEDVKTKDLSLLKLDVGYDFPGTFCSANQLKFYFNPEIRDASWERSKELDEYRKGEEDCVFTQFYIQKLDGFAKISEPWLFHRIHDCKRDYGN